LPGAHETPSALTNGGAVVFGVSGSNGWNRLLQAELVNGLCVRQERLCSGKLTPS
jgi:hypothetical protein